MKKYKSYLFLLLSVATLISSCKEEEKPEFDRKAMLTNMASAVIIPAYQSLNASLAVFNTKALDFIANPTTTTLNELRSQYIITNKNYQRCAMYSFGPALDYGIKGAFNTFPTDSAKIEANITAGTYTLGSGANTTAIGFPVIDYLLYFVSDMYNGENSGLTERLYWSNLTEAVSVYLKKLNGFLLRDRLNYFLAPLSRFVKIRYNIVSFILV